jgi:phage tail P2-like protein
MLDIKDGELLDLLPSQYKNTDAICLSYALKKAVERVLQYEKDSMVLNFIDQLPEYILDVLAVEWNIPWYDSTYTLKQKRRIIAKSDVVKCYMGSAYSIRMQLDTVYPGSDFEEWFDYNGTPGHFRISLDISDSTPDDPAQEMTAQELERKFITAKKWSAHIDSFSYMIRNALKISRKIEAFYYDAPRCGTIYCGTYWMPSTLGYAEHGALQVGARPEPFGYTPPFTGTLPDISTLGYSEEGELQTGASIGAYAVEFPESGTEKSGVIPRTSRLGYSENSRLTAKVSGRDIAEAFGVSPGFSGVLHCGEST